MNKEIENYSSSAIKRTLLRQFGNLPKINYNNFLNQIENQNQNQNQIENQIENNFKILESASFYYLNLIKSEDKRDLYESNCLLSRVKW